MIIFSKDVWWLYAGRISSGFSMGFSMIVEPIFTAEICSDRLHSFSIKFQKQKCFEKNVIFFILIMLPYCSVRGALNSLNFIIFNGSYILGLILSMFCDYKQQAICSAFVPILFLILISILPETPEFLWRQNKNNVIFLHFFYWKQN